MDGINAPPGEGPLRMAAYAILRNEKPPHNGPLVGFLTVESARKWKEENVDDWLEFHWDDGMWEDWKNSMKIQTDKYDLF